MASNEALPDLSSLRLSSRSLASVKKLIPIDQADYNSVTGDKCIKQNVIIISLSLSLFSVGVYFKVSLSFFVVKEAIAYQELESSSNGCPKMEYKVFANQFAKQQVSCDQVENRSVSLLGREEAS